MKKKAVLYLRKDLSGQRQERDLYEMRNLAHNKGYDIARTLTIGKDLYAPFLSLLNTINHVGASLVIVPDLDHLERGERAITEKCTLITSRTESLWPKGYQWPSPVAPPPRYRGAY